MCDELVNPVNIGTLRRDLEIDIGRDKSLQPLFLFCPPEIESGLHQPDDLVAALHMTLLSQKMDQYVFSKAYLIDPRGDVPELSFCADIIEIGRKKPCQLLGQTVYRANIAIEELGDVPGKKVGVLYEHPTYGKVNNQGG